MAPACKQVLCITLGICVATWAFVFVALLVMAPYLPMTAGLTPNQTFGVISLAATLMMARSPASMVTVLSSPLGAYLPVILTPYLAHSPQAMHPLCCDDLPRRMLFLDAVLKTSD